MGMNEAGLSVLTGSARSDWIRLRTLILLRWLAVLGQTGAVAVAELALGIELPLGACAAVIAASAAFNIVAAFIHPENKRLSERASALTLLFDLIQLGLLLALTGGLANPFAVLVLAPVTISATVLTLRATVLLAAAALALISLIAWVHVPLRFLDGSQLVLPPVYLAGKWAALAIGIVFLALYARRVADETFSMSQALVATQLALAREQRLTALGGLVAATAHELGTPLATIKLAATELARELEGRADLRAELREDVELIRTQADRCRDILRSLGRAGRDDRQIRAAPVSAVVAEAAEPHAERGRALILRIGGQPVAAGEVPPGQPLMLRSPEIIHGLRNLIQNAVDFATARVWIDIGWDARSLRVAVGDDGPGYPPDMLGRLGDPFLRRRGEAMRARGERPGYEGMGLGLFIAKTLLERSGARVTFTNGSEPGRQARRAESGDPARARPPGAIAEVVWKRGDIEAPPDMLRGPLGENPRF